jgi:putative oxidoreductase
MATHPQVGPHYEGLSEAPRVRMSDWGRYVVPVARALYVAVFLVAVPEHFTTPAIHYAARHGVPLTAALVPLSGVIAALGSLSVLFGFHARVGAWLLVVFLVPVTLTMHNFWAMTDPAAEQLQRIMFLKNVSMLGAALLVAWFGAGPGSIDSWKGQAPRTD